MTAVTYFAAVKGPLPTESGYPLSIGERYTPPLRDGEPFGCDAVHIAEGKLRRAPDEDQPGYKAPKAPAKKIEEAA